MERLIVVIARDEDVNRAIGAAKSTRDGELLDLDIFEHASTFTLEAFKKADPDPTREPGRRGADTVAWCPIQQPLMMENLIFAPGLSEQQTAQAIMRLAEHAVEEAYRRDAGEIYFLCRDESTCKFAERYGFIDVATLRTPLKCYRMNLLETFGV